MAVPPALVTGRPEDFRYHDLVCSAMLRGHPDGVLHASGERHTVLADHYRSTRDALGSIWPEAHGVVTCGERLSQWSGEDNDSHLCTGVPDEAGEQIRMSLEIGASKKRYLGCDMRLRGPSDRHPVRRFRNHTRFNRQPCTDYFQAISAVTQRDRLVTQRQIPGHTLLRRRAMAPGCHGS